MSPTSRALRSTIAVAWPAIFAVLVGCIVIHPRPPSPLKGVTSVVVSFDYTGLMVAGMGGDKTEEQWVTAKTAEDPKYPSTWADLKSRWESNFVDGMVNASPVPVLRANGEPVPDTAAVVTVRLSRFQLGKYMVVTSTASETNVANTWSRGGQVVDQNTSNAAVRPSLTNPSVFQHIVDLGRDSGRSAGKFLAQAQRT